MATYFVASGGSNTAPYDTWAKAATSLQTALTAASTAGDIVVIQYDGVPAGDAENAADVTYTFAADISLISASNAGGSAYTPTAMGDSYWIGHSTSNRSISIAGVFVVYVYGVTIRNAGSVADSIQLAVEEADHIYESCTFWLGNTNTTMFIRLTGASGANSNNHQVYKNCVFRLGNTAQGLSIGGGAGLQLYGCSLHASTAVPTTLFKAVNSMATVLCDGCDWSAAGTNMAFANSGGGRIVYTVANCRVPASWVFLPAQVPTNLAASEVYVFNCASGDTHFNFGYYNARGSLVSSSGIYASGGAKYDGTNGVSWQIDTTAYATYAAPFVTPWIDLYHSGTAAITPKLEILRDGSATAYDNDEVWAEFSYQGTSGSTKATIVDDRMAIAGTPAAQTTGDLGAGDWTGEGGTAWFGKLNTTSAITPAEIGMLRARVCVGLASATVYVDPYIRIA